MTVEDVVAHGTAVPHVLGLYHIDLCRSFPLALRVAARVAGAEPEVVGRAVLLSLHDTRTGLHSVEPEETGVQGEHAEVGDRPLLRAGSAAPELLEAVDRAFDDSAHRIGPRSQRGARRSCIPPSSWDPAPGRRAVAGPRGTVVGWCIERRVPPSLPASCST